MISSGWREAGLLEQQCISSMASGYTISRVNPLFVDEPLSVDVVLLSTCLRVPSAGEDSVRHLSESVSRSPTLLAVCRALEARGDINGYEQVPDLTLDAGGAAHLLALVDAGRRRRCCCRLLIAVLAAAALLAALVAVSLALSRGQRVFGSL